MNKVLLVGRLTRDPELRSLPSGKPVANLNGADYTNAEISTRHADARPSRRVPPPLLR
jgi:single-stranded DNA-binding protein